MSIYATNYITDEETGKAKLVKHLNQKRIDRNYGGRPPGKWGKTGKNRSWFAKGIWTRAYQSKMNKEIIEKELNG
jgi:hypothetical protein